MKKGEIKKMLLQQLKRKLFDEEGKGKFAEKLKGMRKVTVASPTAEGLKEGLSKAQEILEKRKEMKNDKSSMLDELLDNKEDDEDEDLE